LKDDTLDEFETDEVTMDDDVNTALPDVADKPVYDSSESELAAHVEYRFNTAEDGRREDEERWTMCYRNFRGLYGADVQFTETERSRVFVKITKTKVFAAYGSITDVLLGAGKFPISIDPTTLPDGVDNAVHFDTQAAPEQADTLPTLEPGETRSVYERLKGNLKNKLGPVQSKLKVGEGRTPTAVTIHPAMIAAKKMEKKIHDQLNEAGANKEMRRFAMDMCLYGHGICEGPYAIEKEYPKWDEGGNYDPLLKTMPVMSHVKLWDFYPDPDAENMDECEYVVRRRKMSRSKLRKLKSRPFFRSNSINQAIEMGENYSPKWWEHNIEDDDLHNPQERYEVLEYWGTMDTDKINDFGVKIPTHLKNAEQLSVNIWVCNGLVLRMVMNPFQPTYLPFYACPYEINPNSFFGVGVAENMEDTQLLMNGFMRMAVDNAALSGNLLIEVDETNLVPGQDMDIYPGKKFRRQGGAPGQAIHGTKFPNVSSENMMMFDKARVLSDESTGIPSFSHGQTGVTGVGRTAAGISMLMGAANGGIRTVIKNIDDYFLEPLGKAFFRFNMQFDHDDEIKGDLAIKAGGTNSLMSTEVQSQRLMQFLQILQNPALAPFGKMDAIMQEITRSLGLDPDKFTNSMADAALQAEIMKSMQPEPPAGGPAGSPTNAVNPQDAGNIGVGNATQPGEAGYTGGGPNDPQANG
jgi:hypothetical protein